MWGWAQQPRLKNLIFVDDRFLELYLIFHHGTTMATETEQFTTVIMVLPADDSVDYFSLENTKPSFSYLCIHIMVIGMQYTYFKIKFHSTEKEC